MEHSQLHQFIQGITTEFDYIETDRKAVLTSLAEQVSDHLKTKGCADLLFICTHNSRRSHLSQVWAQVAAFHYGIQSVRSYSGGTEATAFYPTALATLVHAGLIVNKLSDAGNPVYSIKFHLDEPAIIGFSKVYDDLFNVQSGFVAVMTCSHADENCPFIPTAATRISLPYDDPKEFDGTALETEKYTERSKDIARELFYVFSQVTS